MEIQGNFSTITAAAARDALGVTNELTKKRSNSDKIVFTDLADTVPAKVFPTVVNRQANLVGDFVAVGDGTTNDSAKIQAAIDALWNRGGGELLVPPLAFGIGTPVIYRDGVQLVGCGASPSGVPSAIGKTFVGSSFRAIANLPAMFTQSDMTTPLHSIGMRRCNVDAGQARGFIVDCAVNLSFLNSRFTQNFFRQATGTGFANRWNPVAAWINWFSENYVEFCGTGLLWEGTDSYIHHNYLSSCKGFNFILDGTGSNQVHGNMIDGAGRDNTTALVNSNAIALLMRNTKYRNAYERVIRNVIVGNNFGENAAGDILIEDFKPADNSIMACQSTFWGNKHHNLSGNSVTIGEGNRGGIIAGCNFTDIGSPTSAAVVFSGNSTRSQGWSLGPNTFSTGNGEANFLKYYNAPSGTMIMGYQ